MSRSKPGTEDRVNAEWTPPRGIRYREIEGQPRPFGVIWREDGKERAKFFALAEQREEYARKLADERESVITQRAAFDGFTVESWREYQAAKEMAGEADLRRVVREWLAGSPKIKDSLSVDDAVVKYLTLRYSAGIDRESDTGRHLELHLRRRFLTAAKGLKLDEITPDFVREWMASIVSKKTGERLGNLARRQHRKDLNAFFVKAMMEGWCTKNPCDAVETPKIKTEDVKILTVAQAKQLLETNKGFPIAPKLALEMFGGLRTSSVERIKKEHIDFEAKGIRFPGDLHKTGKTKYRQGQPEALWHWLAFATEKTWTEITISNYAHEKVKAVRRAFGQDFTLPHNVLRHSFASYHLAAFKSLQNTGYLMQHTSGHTTSIYEGVAREADALAYFGILPNSEK